MYVTWGLMSGIIYPWQGQGPSTRRRGADGSTAPCRGVEMSIGLSGGLRPETTIDLVVRGIEGLCNRNDHVQAKYMTIYYISPSLNNPCMN